VRAECILSPTNTIERELQSFGQGMNGILTVGSVFLCLLALPDSLDVVAVLQLSPAAHRGAQRGAAEIISMLKQGEVDVSVVRMPFSEDGLDGCYAPADPMAALIPAVSTVTEKRRR
jgi:hypothetical protein